MMRVGLSMAAALVVGAAGGAQADAPERLRLGYALYVGGFSAMEGEVDLTLGPDRYEVALRAQTRGLIETPASWRTSAASRGARAGAELATVDHEAFNLWRGQTRRVSVRYDRSGTAQAAAEPDAATDDREPVTAAQTRATLDPLSGFVAVMEDVRRGRGCGRTVAAFDGRRRFDLRFRDLGRQATPISDYAALSGVPAQRCSVEYPPVAGFKRGRERSVFWRGRDGERPATHVWFATPVAGGPIVPVRFETETPLGAVVVHLTRAEVAGN